MRAQTLVLLFGLALACVTRPETGIMAGRLEEPGKPPLPVTFTFDSDTYSHEGGNLHATLPDGERFYGNYLRISNGTETRWIEPIYTGFGQPVWEGVGFGPGGAWEYAGAGAPLVDFQKHYTGQVLASLGGNRGTQMRCRFHLVDPQQGLLGGGTGECQVSNGATIQVKI